MYHLDQINLYLNRFASVAYTNEGKSEMIVWGKSAESGYKRDVVQHFFGVEEQIVQLRIDDPND